MIATAPLAPARASPSPSFAAYTRERVVFLLKHYHELGDGPLVLDRGEVESAAATGVDHHGHRVKRPIRPQGGFELAICERADLDAGLATLVREDWGWRGGQWVLIFRDSFDLRAVFGMDVAGYKLVQLAELLRCDRYFLRDRYERAMDRLVDAMNRGGERRPWSLVAAILKPLGWLD